MTCSPIAIVVYRSESISSWKYDVGRGQMMCAYPVVHTVVLDVCAVSGDNSDVLPWLQLVRRHKCVVCHAHKVALLLPWCVCMDAPQTPHVSRVSKYTSLAEILAIFRSLTVLSTITMHQQGAPYLDDVRCWLYKKDILVRCLNGQAIIEIRSLMEESDFLSESCFSQDSILTTV